MRLHRTISNFSENGELEWDQISTPTSRPFTHQRNSLPSFNQKISAPVAQSPVARPAGLILNDLVKKHSAQIISWMRNPTPGSGLPGRDERVPGIIIAEQAGLDARLERLDFRMDPRGKLTRLLTIRTNFPNEFLDKGGLGVGLIITLEPGMEENLRVSQRFWGDWPSSALREETLGFIDLLQQFSTVCPFLLLGFVTEALRELRQNLNKCKPT